MNPESIEAAVRGVPGVVSVYATGLAGRLVTIDGDRVSVSVGVDTTRQAPVTAADVAAAIRSVAPDARVSVRIGRVS